MVHTPCFSKALLLLLGLYLLPVRPCASDLVFQRSDGTFRLWHLDANQAKGPLLITPNHANHDPRWRIAGTGIFNGAGNADLLFQYHDGLLALWYMDELTQTSSTLFYPDKPESLKWRLVGSGDLDGDGAQDLVFQSEDGKIHGPLLVWLMRGPHDARPAPVAPPDPEPGFQLCAIADLDGDRKADLIFQEPGSEKLQVWLMNGVTRRVSEGVEPAGPDPGFRLKGATDVDGDGRTDLIFQKQKTIQVWKMNHLQRLGEAIDIVPPGLDREEMMVAAGSFLRSGTSPQPPPPSEDEALKNRSQRLSRWVAARREFKSDRGDAPLSFQDLSTNEEGTATVVKVLEPNAQWVLPTQSTNGEPLMTFRPGTFKFRFRPDWTRRHNIGGRGSGPGPGRLATLLSVGDRVGSPDAGWFDLVVGELADTVTFQTRNQAGRQVTLLYEASSAALRHLQFESNVWTEFTLVLETNKVEIWQEDFLLASTNTSQALPLPPESVFRRGLSIGNIVSGGRPARGAFDELECFSYPFGVFEHSEFHVIATVSRKPPGIQLEWRRNPFRRLSIRRRLLTEPTPTLMATNVTGSTWLDTGVIAGERYEYVIFDPNTTDRASGSITASLDGAPIEYRGRALLLVDETVEGNLSEDLRGFEKDLIGDGWSVGRRSVPRHNDNRWSRNPSAIEKVRGLIQEEYQAAKGELRTVILVGHVAVPYSGFAAEDGHTAKGDNHFGAWPTDLHFADIDGQWTDIDRYPLPFETAFPETMNTPGDGKFDQSRVPRNSAGISSIEVSVGRVDFARLDGYLGERISETTLLKRYFEKNHRYRHGDLSFPARAIVEGFSHPNENRILYNNAIYNSRRNFGPGSDALVMGDLYRIKQAALWGFQAGFGYVNMMNNNQSNPWSTESATRPGQAPAIAFYMLSGSWFGDWNLAGNLLRGVLAPPNSGLASCWMRGHLMRFDTMAVGGTLGDALKATANDPNQAATMLGAPRTMSLLGDPTLRGAVTPPPAAVRVSKLDDDILVTWQEAAGQPLGYFVYSSPYALGPFTNRLTKRPITGTKHRDVGASKEKSYYAVRSVQQITTGAGTYTNLSQAAFVKKRN